MRTHRFGWAISVCALFSAVYGVADAQTAKPNPGGDTSVGMQRQVNLSPQEQLAQADAFVARMGVTGSGVRRMLEQARQARDVVKTLCLNDKLNQIDVAIRSARDRKSSLQAAVGSKNAEQSNHEFTILTVLRQRTEQLTAEANQCIGEEVAFIGATQVVTQIDPTLPGEDTTPYPPTDPTLVSSPPLCGSCTF